MHNALAACSAEQDAGRPTLRATDRHVTTRKGSVVTTSWRTVNLPLPKPSGPFPRPLQTFTTMKSTPQCRNPEKDHDIAPPQFYPRRSECYQRSAPHALRRQLHDQFALPRAYRTTSDLHNVLPASCEELLVTGLSSVRDEPPRHHSQVKRCEDKLANCELVPFGACC